MIRVKGDINEETFNEAYMMATNTSAPCSRSTTETAAAMMKGTR